MNFKFAYTSIAWGPKADIDGMLYEIKEAGYRGVEFQIGIDDLGEPYQLKKRVKVSELEIAAIAGDSGKDSLLGKDSQAVEVNRRIVDYIASIGSKILMIAAGWVNNKNKGMETYRTFFKNLEEIAKYASDKGVLVAFHNHLDTLVETEEEIDFLMASTKHLKLCPDTAHLALAGVNPVSMIRKYHNRVAYLHLKDYALELERRSLPYRNWRPGEFCELGEGRIGIDFAGIIKTLEDIGYRGWVAVEMDRSRNWKDETGDNCLPGYRRKPGESAKISHDYLRKIERIITIDERQ